MDSARLWYALRRWWGVLLACVVVGLLAGFLYLRLTPAQYTARADVMVAVGGADAIDLSSGSSFAQQQARNLSVIATRQLVIDPVIRRLSLPETAGELSQDITATVPANTSIVTLEVTSASPEGAAAIANAMADSLAQTARDILPSVRRGGADIALRTVYQGSVPQTPTGPSTATSVTVGAAAGLIGGIALLLLLEFLARGPQRAPGSARSERSSRPLVENSAAAEEQKQFSW